MGSWPLRPLLFALSVSALLAWRRAPDIDARADRSKALTRALLTREDLIATDVLWLREESGTLGAMTNDARALVRAHLPNEPADLYMVSARLAPNGALLDLGEAYDLTRTTGVDEGVPVMRGKLAAYATRVDPVVTAVHTLDLAGKDPNELSDFTKTQRWQIALTNVQKTGQPEGVLRASYALDPVADKVEIAWDDAGLLRVRADGHVIVIDPQKAEAVQGSGWVRAQPEAIARPGNLVTWAVDRVRGMPVFGEERMQWVKFVAFTLLDKVDRWRESFKGASDTEKDVQADIAGLGGEVAFTDPEIGWPPAPITPILSPPIQGEGQWIALDKDPFLTNIPGTPPAFVTTFVRADQERKDTRVYVTMWDPRQIALHMEAGTVEPVSATGEAGPGMIPRTPEVMRRVVAGFNGGFQAMHGEYGMQVSGALYLPPKPYAATVMELRDGTTGFGSWPGAPDVPQDVLSYRQNLTALVEHGKFNPWGRTWWGGTPKGWEDEIHTTRSGLCLTKENWVGYFWGNSISADVLAKSMIAARCVYSVHLDMNPGLAGFEFYNAKPDAEWQPLGRKIEPDWEYEGTFKALPGWRYRARRMIRGMMEQNFPQYIHLDARDFFYLTQRPILPGANLVAPRPGEGVWQTKNLPQHGFPYAVATSWLEPTATKITLVRVDPRVVRPAGSAGTSEQTPTVISFVDATRPRAGSPGLWLGASGFFVGEEREAGMFGVVELGPLGADSSAALCVQDEDGMLAWAELAEGSPSAQTGKDLEGALSKMGCSAFFGVRGHKPRAVLGSVPSTGIEIDARLVRGEGPSAKLFFDTPVVGPGTWQPLQMQRVRYFARPKKPRAEDAGADAPPN